MRVRASELASTRRVSDHGRFGVLQDGRTALMWAADKDHTATAAELVRLGADIHAKDKVRVCEGVELASTRRVSDRGRCGVLQDGLTAFMSAADRGHTATATELVRLGADIHAKDNVRAR